jgi:hypothetical protein
MSSFEFQSFQDFIDAYSRQTPAHATDNTETDTETEYSADNHTTINNITINITNNNITNITNVYIPNHVPLQTTTKMITCSECRYEKSANEFLSTRVRGYTKRCQACRNRTVKYAKDRKDRLTAIQNERDRAPEGSDIHKKKICGKCGCLLDIKEFLGKRGQVKKNCNGCYANFLVYVTCIHKINKSTCKTCGPHLYDVARYRNSLASLLRGFCVSPDILDSLGCDYAQFRRHLERLFTPEMNWGNHRDAWQIDFYYPLLEIVNGDYLPMAEIERRKHYTNIRPIPKTENLEKSNKAPEAFYDNA